MLVATAISMLVVGLSILLIIMHDRLKAYHAAEHMAFNAYVSTNSTEIETIQRQDRFNPVCGTSLITPLALALAVALFLALYLSITLSISSALLLEGVLSLNSLIG